MSPIASTVPRRGWAPLIAYVALLYTTLPWMRDVLALLYREGLARTIVGSAYLVAAALLVHYVVFVVRLRDRRGVAALAIVMAMIGALVLSLAIAEERMHVLQYGVLALLARHALSGVPAHRRILLAFAIAAAVGWGDELIQGALPRRVYDLRDVVLDALAAALALAADEALHDRLGWRARVVRAG